MPDPILVCVPWLKANELHMEHFREWYAFNREKHTLRCHQMYFKATHQVQARAVILARKMKASHILFTEDDHWGYPIDGLDVLLKADRDVIGFRTYFKRYPFLSMAMRRRNPDEPLSLTTLTQRLRQVEGIAPGTDPIQEVDLLSWAFTLVRMSVFDRMAEAKMNPFERWGPVPTDSFFCQYCGDLLIPRFVHFGYTIGHGDVPPEQIHHYRHLMEAIHTDKKMMQRRLITLEDDHGHPYGQAEWEPGPARIMRGLQEGNGRPPIHYEQKEEQVKCEF